MYHELGPATFRHGERVTAALARAGFIVRAELPRWLSGPGNRERVDVAVLARD